MTGTLLGDLGLGALAYIGQVVAIASAACLPAVVSLWRDPDTTAREWLGLEGDER